MPASDNKSRQFFEKGLSHFHKGEYQNASEFFKEAILEEPQYSEALYNLACCCSMLNDRDSAYLYLHRAARLNPHCLDWAKEDQEFDNIRSDTTFQRLITDKNVDEDDEEDAVVDEPSINTVDFQPLNVDDLEAMQMQSMVQTPAGSPSEPPPNFSDGKPQSTFKAVIPAKYPPCVQCDGPISVEMRPRHNPYYMLGIALMGFLSVLWIFRTWLGIAGISLVVLGFYLFSQIEEIWVCQNCGAMGATCGQPPKKKPKKE